MRKVLIPSALLLATAIAVCAAQPARPARTPGSPRAMTRATTNPSPPPPDPVITEFMKPIDVADGDTDLQRKMKERHNAAVRLLELRVEEYHKGIIQMTPVFEAARAVADAKLELAGNDDERLKVSQQEVDVAKAVEARLEKQVASGFGSEADLQRAKLTRLNAEVEVLKLKQSRESAKTRP
jgi:hypothetical protein